MTGSVDDIQMEFLVEGLEDYVGLWEWVSRVKWANPDLPDEDLRSEVLDLLRGVLEGGYMRAGQLADQGGFLEWDLTPADAMASIEREWTALGREPTIADICWFDNTDRGDALASADR